MLRLCNQTHKLFKDYQNNEHENDGNEEEELNWRKGRQKSQLK